MFIAGIRPGRRIPFVSAYCKTNKIIPQTSSRTKALEAGRPTSP